MLVQDFIRARGLSALSEFTIKAVPHKRYNNLFLLKYDQIDSPFSNPMVRECRGLILDQDRDWAVVARPYDKFFNHGETHAAEIDWSTARVFEKLDGSLITLYHYDGNWHVATSGTPDASGEVSPGLTFAELFCRTFRTTLSGFDPTCCYMFELCCPENRIVCRYPEPRVYLHGARHIETGQEFIPDIEGVMLAPSYPLSDLPAVLEAVNRNPLEHEGFVVVDAKFNRLKIKSAAYVALHHCRDGFSKKRIANLLRAGEASEFEKSLYAFPELRPMFDDLQLRYLKASAGMAADWAAHRHIENRAEFAKLVKDLPYSGYLFAKHSGKPETPGGYLAKMSEAAYLRLSDQMQDT